MIMMVAWHVVRQFLQTQVNLLSRKQLTGARFGPNERGPFNVGHVQVEHTYVPLSDQPARTIPIEILHSTEDTSGSTTMYFVGVDETVFSNATPAEPIYSRIPGASLISRLSRMGVPTPLF